MSQDSVLRVNGWQLFVHPEFEQYLTDLVERVTRKKKKDPGNYKQNRYYKLLKRINELIYREIPSDPNVRRYYLKKELKQLRRAKIQRYRLFFSF